MNPNKSSTPLLLGAIAGDIIGSVFELRSIKTTEFELFRSRSKFTDDTAMIIAMADSIINNKPFAPTLQEYGRKYSKLRYGGSFKEWIYSDQPKPYHSYGNGSAMRVCPIGYAYHSEAEVLEKAKESAEITHNHIEGIKGAQAIAICIYLARTGHSKLQIKDYVTHQFEYDLSKTIDEIRPDYHLDLSCQGSVPQAITAFLESTNYESAIRLAVSIGGDSDTIACMAGAIAQAFYKEIPIDIITHSMNLLPIDFKTIMDKFDHKYLLST